MTYLLRCLSLLIGLTAPSLAFAGPVTYCANEGDQVPPDEYIEESFEYLYTFGSDTTPFGIPFNMYSPTGCAVTDLKLAGEVHLPSRVGAAALTYNFEGEEVTQIFDVRFGGSLDPLPLGTPTFWAMAFTPAQSATEPYLLPDGFMFQFIFVEGLGPQGQLNYSDACPEFPCRPLNYFFGVSQMLLSDILAPVPLPASLPLALLGLGALTACSRKRHLRAPRAR